jgi:hypothetical protein
MVLNVEYLPTKTFRCDKKANYMLKHTVFYRF